MKQFLLAWSLLLVSISMMGITVRLLNFIFGMFNVPAQLPT